MRKLKCFSFAAMLLASSFCIMAVEDQSLPEKDIDAALGINSFFGRWNGPVNLVYDPDGVPGLFSDNNTFLSILEEATQKWELVSGINFNITGVDSDAPDDDNLDNNSQDGLVRIYWNALGGSAGRAGPGIGFYDSDVGYYPYYDGTLELNDNPDSWDSSNELLETLVHELGHLIGLGHSDNPDSVMYANPYNHLNNPREDDIRAVRALYGLGTLDIEDISQPISQWVYEPLPMAPASATEDLFKANLVTDTGAFIELGDDVPLTDVNANTADGLTVFFSYGLGPSNSDINIDASVVFVDPFGYVYDDRQTVLECEANFSCGRGLSISSTSVLKTIPGDWTVYIVDNDNQQTLLEFPFSVNTQVSFNQAPQAEITVEGISNTSINVSLAVSDAESDDITVIWHPHGNLGDQDNDGFLDTEVRDSAQSGQVVSRDINFLNADTHTLYIELIDDSDRYNGSNAGSGPSGDGFQSLIALTVDLPVDSDNNVSIITTYGEATASNNNSVSNDEVVDSIAGSTELELITTSDGSSTSAGFGAGASSDSGSSTATDFSDGDEITIAGSVEPQSEDVGEAGEIFIVLYTDEGLTYKDLNGDFVTWNGSLKTMEPALETSSLTSLEKFEVFSGSVQSGLYRVFLGYRLTDVGPIHFNAKAFRITVN